MHASPKKFNTPNRGASQNQLIRTNHSRRIQLLGDNGNGLVAQGAALVAGPEAFFSLSVPPTIPETPRRTKPCIMNTCASTHVTPAECALTVANPNSFVMNTYIKIVGGGQVLFGEPPSVLRDRNARAAVMWHSHSWLCGMRNAATSAQARVPVPPKGVPLPWSMDLSANR
jgi:hypothetical protein